jgi:SAM-dependent methyltransferase
MDTQEIRQHWSNWASTYGTSLRATTKTWTAKALEIDALYRRLRMVLPDSGSADILEIGCGNGVNCIELAKQIPQGHFDGVDYVDQMVDAAIENVRSSNVAERMRFFVGDVLQLNQLSALKQTYDVVFTDRCLINLNTLDLQMRAITALAAKVKAGGHLLMIENSTTTYDRQNDCRALLGLPRRKPADFNLFFDEAAITKHLGDIGLDLTDVEDFSSLHDLVLYVLVPAINGGEVQYDHPLVEAATTLSKELGAGGSEAFGSFGQNRLFVCRRTA